MFKYLERIKSVVKGKLEVLGLFSWMRTTSFPGAFGVTLYDLYLFVRKESRQFDISVRANSMSFNFFLSLFPLLLVMFTIIPFLPLNDHFFETLRAAIMEVMPGKTGKSLYSFIKDLATKPQLNLLSVSSILVIYFASNGVMAMINGFEKSYPTTFEEWPGWYKRLRAIGLTFLLAVILLASIILIILGNVILKWFYSLTGIIPSSFQSGSFHLLRWLVIIALYYTGISSIYRFAVSARKRFAFFTPGATLATVLSLLTSYLFSFYIDNFSSYNKLYGSIGTVIALMLWIQFNAFILIIGFELNASIAITRDMKIMEERNDLF